MQSSIRLLFCCVMASFFIAGCDNPISERNSMANADTTITPEELQRVANLHVIFGHQSVGNDLLAGVRSLADAQGVPITITESRAPTSEAGVQHFSIGRNEQPATKISDFATVLRSGVAAGADVALFKLCYIDFTATTDPKQLAGDYIEALNQLGAEYPKTRFIAVTAPLTTIQSGPKAWLKSLMGRTPGGYEENARRYIFNQTLRNHYNRPDLFDLAAIESGNRSITANYKGELIEALDPNLTYDGGHLNATGQELAGAALIRHLSAIEPK